VKRYEVAGGFRYPEAPRWHAGELWFSDLHDGVVQAVTPEGSVRAVVDVPGTPGGLGFEPDGTPLVVSMDDHAVLRVRNRALHRFADLSPLSRGRLNDMVTRSDGTCFVGTFGYDLALHEKPVPAPLLRVTPAGEVSEAAQGLMFANGMGFMHGERTLLVAETPAQRITAFHVDDDGTLDGRATFAEVRPRAADGICIDAEGGVWFGSPFTSEFVRVERGGRVTHVIPTPGSWAVACAFGGDALECLYLLTAETDMTRFHAGHSVGRIEAVVPPVPAAHLGTKVSD
jgi:sugar lactone lactonase YvrE